MELERVYRGFVSQLEEVNFWIHKAEEAIVRHERLSPERAMSESEIHRFKVGHFKKYFFSYFIPVVGSKGLEKCYHRAWFLFNPLMTTPFWTEKQTDVFKPYFFNENAWILKNIWLKFFRNVVIYPKSALIQEMDWRQSGANPFLEAMLKNTFYSCQSLQSFKG